MKKMITLLFLATSVSFDSSALFANDSTPEMTLTVGLINYADVRDDLLAQAKRETADVFGKIGVKIVWRDIDVPKRKRTIDEILAAATVQEPQLSVHLLPKAKQWHPQDTVLGYAPRKENEPGRLVSIFYDRLRELARETKALSPWAPTEAELLGRAPGQAGGSHHGSRDRTPAASLPLAHEGWNHDTPLESRCHAERGTG